ncbi:ankyrin-2-like [Anopheles albimanus]|nr:ankyrin-2-like [Anopheles albimanus]
MPRHACYRTHSHVAPYHEGVFRKRSLKGGTTRAQWEDVTGSTPLTFVNDCVSFTTTVSARFWLMDCRNIADATKMATELYKEAIHVPFMAKFVVFAKRTDTLEARLRVFCMTDDREDKTLEHQEHFTEVAKSRDVEVLEDKPQYIELAGNLVPVTKSGEQLSLPFKAFRENRLPFAVRVKDQHADIVGRTLFMREPKIAKGEPPQQPICILNIVLPETIIPEQTTTTIRDSHEIMLRVGRSRAVAPPRQLVDDQNYLGELRLVDISNLLGEDWIKLAPEIGVSETDVENIVAQIPTSTAQQAQAMLKQFQSKPNNDFNILENGLRTIHRDDIVERCIRSATTTGTTTTVTMRNKASFSIGKRNVDAVDLLTETDSIAKMAQKDDRLSKKESTKYSVEEKSVVEESEESEEELVKKTVAERRKQIEKRLSADRSIPASAQKKEIVEEIISIKRQSVIDDTRARHEEEILMQKPIDNTYKSATMPEPVVKLKTAVVKDGPTVRKDEFDQELQDRFKSTLKNVEEFEHKSQVLEHIMVSDATQSIHTTAPRVVEELKKPTEEQSLPELVEVRQRIVPSSEDVPCTPVPRERAPIPAKRTSLTKEEPEEFTTVIEESIKDVKQRISSFETKTKTETMHDSKQSSKEAGGAHESWIEEHRKELKQAVEERAATMREHSDDDLIVSEKSLSQTQTHTVEESSKVTSSQQQHESSVTEQIKLQSVSFAPEKDSFSDEPTSEGNMPSVDGTQWQDQDSEPSSMSEGLRQVHHVTTTEESFSQQFKSETVSKIEEKVTKIGATVESTSTISALATQLHGVEAPLHLEKDDRAVVREEFVARSAESSSIIDRKIESVVREQHDMQPAVERHDVQREVREISDKLAGAVMKETLLLDDGTTPILSSTEAYTVETFDGLTSETMHKDASGMVAELKGQTVSSIETGVCEGEEMVSEKIVEKEEELRRKEEKVATQTTDVPAVTETVSRIISQEITSKIPVASKKVSPESSEPPARSEEAETREQHKRTTESSSELKYESELDSVTSKIPRFDSSKPPVKLPDVTPIKSPEPDSTNLSKIPILKDRKVSEQFSSDSCETVIMQKSQIEQYDQHLLSKDDSEDRSLERVDEAKIAVEAAYEQQDEDAEVMQATIASERVNDLTEIITADNRAVTPDDFIDEIIEEAHDKVQQLQSAEITLGTTLDLSHSEEEQFDKSGYRMPEYVSEARNTGRYYETEPFGEEGDQDDHEKWKDTFTDVHDDALQTSASFEGDEYLVLVQSEACQLIESVLEQSVSIVSSSQPAGPLTNDREHQVPSESEQYAIRSDILSSTDGDMVVKSPTIESMSGKSFDDNMSNPEYDALLLETALTAPACTPAATSQPTSGDDHEEVPDDQISRVPDLPQVADSPISSTVDLEAGADHDNGDDDDDDGDDKNDEKPVCGPLEAITAAAESATARRAKKIERKYARLSADLGPEVLLDKNPEYDDAISQIKDEVSILQSEYSKLSWDESMSVTTGDFGSSTPDNDLQETEMQLQTDTNVPLTASRTQAKPIAADADAAIAFEHEVSEDASVTSVSNVVVASRAADVTAANTVATDATAATNASASSLTGSALEMAVEHSAATGVTTSLESTVSSVHHHARLEDQSVSVTTLSEPEKGSDSSSLDGHPVPKGRTSISSRTDTATRSSLLESFEHQDSIEQYPEPVPPAEVDRYRQGSITSDDMSNVAQKDSSEIVTSEEDISTAGAKFFIGECSSDIITRTPATDKRQEFAFDNEGYTFSQDSQDASEDSSRVRGDTFQEYQQQIKQEDGFTLDSLKELDDIRSTGTGPVLHSPIVAPVEPEPAESRASVEARIESLQYAAMTSDELAIAKTLDEVKESLDAIQDELIEAGVMDGTPIKQSPSEFELKVLPPSRYAQDPIYETNQEIDTAAPVAAFTETTAAAGDTSESDEPGPGMVAAGPPIRIDEAAAAATTGSSDSSQAKLDVSMRTRMGPHSAVHVASSRWSATDVDSSGESHYQSLEHTDSSRPVSSDLENVLQYVSSEYETALDHSTVRTSATGTEYHSAVSTLNSYQAGSQHDSLKSFDSESSGNLASIESEATETLVPSTMDVDFDSSDAALIHEDSEDDLREKVVLLMDTETEEPIAAAGASTSSSIPIAMKRSHEMDFAELGQDGLGRAGSLEATDAELVRVQEEKLSSSIGTAHDLVESMQAMSSCEDVKTEGFSEEAKLGTSLEDGSILSISLSSASNLETIMETPATIPSAGATHADVGLDAVTPTSTMPGGPGSMIIGDITLTSTVLTEGNVNFLNTQATTELIQTVTTTTVAVGHGQGDDSTEESGSEPRSKRGHKRTESTAIISGKFVAEMGENRDSVESQDDSLSLEASKPPSSSSERDEMRDESSDSDYDRYESEYARSFRAPVAQSKKKDKMVGDVFEKDLGELDRRNSFSPSQSVIETIVEDVHAEIEQSDEAHRIMVSKSQRLQEYRETSTHNIPDIHVTDDFAEVEPMVEDVQEPEAPAPAPDVPVPPKRSGSSAAGATPDAGAGSTAGSSSSAPRGVQYAKQEEFQLTEEQYQELIEQKYKAKLADTTTKYGFDLDDKDDSAGSDSFEMLEQPDITDEFVIVEEVAREAHEFDSEGKSVAIKPVKLEKKHDEDVEKMLVKSAPAHTNAGSLYAANMRDDMMYEFEESPPTGADGGGVGEEVEGAGVTMDILNNGYPLEESKRWVEMQLADTQNFRYPYEDRLEDIKEEDTDFEVGSSRIGSIKDSFSSTPDYDLLAKRMASREHDDISMSSLQEFENLEHVISLENRKMQQGSQDSLSNGSFTRRFMQRGGTHGDDISLSSLKEFEGLESACLEAHLIEIKAKEEAALLLSRSDESNKSDRSNGGPKRASPPSNGGTGSAALVKGAPGASQTISSSTVTTSTSVIGPVEGEPAEVATIITSTTTQVTSRKTASELSKEAFGAHSGTGSMVTTTTVTTTAITQESQARNAFEEEDTSHILTVSSDSLDAGTRLMRQADGSVSGRDTHASIHSSNDSLEMSNRNNVPDPMTSSIDSIEFSKTGLATTRSSQSDSIEHMLAQQQQPQRSDSTDSIEAQQALQQQQQQQQLILQHRESSGTGGSDSQSGFSSPTKSVHGPPGVTSESSFVAAFGSGTSQQQHGMSAYATTVMATTHHVTAVGGLQKEISADSLTGPDAAFLTSTESLETSSTATNATYQNETDSQMSSSVTSCDSITMVDSAAGPMADLEHFHLGTAFGSSSVATQLHYSSQQQQQHVYHTSSTVRTTTTSSSTSSASSSTALRVQQQQMGPVELLSSELFPGDIAFDEVKESAKEKQQSKTPEKEE